MQPFLGPGLTRKHCCGNIAADANVSQFSCARNMLQMQILHLGSKEMFLNQVKNISTSQTQILLLKRMFLNLTTQGNMSGNNVSATMFPSLARPLGSSRNAIGDYCVRD